MKRLLLIALLTVAGCAKVQETPILEVHSSDAWHMVVSTRQVPLQVGSNSFVIALQSPDRAWVRPGDVQVKMTMAPKVPVNGTGPVTVNLQPDGENGHYLAIVDLPVAAEWQSRLTVNHRTVDHNIDFELSNRPR